MRQVLAIECLPKLNQPAFLFSFSISLLSLFLSLFLFLFFSLSIFFSDTTAVPYPPYACMPLPKCKEACKGLIRRHLPRRAFVRLLSVCCCCFVFLGLGAGGCWAGGTNAYLIPRIQALPGHIVDQFS